MTLKKPQAHEFKLTNHFFADALNGGPTTHHASGKPAAAKPAKTQPAHAKPAHPETKGHTEKPSGYTAPKGHAPYQLKKLNGGAHHKPDVKKWADPKTNDTTFKNLQVKEHTQAVKDYVDGIRENPNSGPKQRDSMKRAGEHVRALNHILKTDKTLTAHDRQAIAATKNIYANFQRVNWGQSGREDPDIHLLKMTHPRYAQDGGSLTTRLKDTRVAQFDKGHKGHEDHKVKNSAPKRLDPDKLPKEPWKKPGYKGPVPFNVAHSGKPHGRGPVRIAPNHKG